MPSKKQYNLVSDDAYDSRIPLYNEEAFQHGITFHAKYIGSLDVPRPSSRVEIVAAMRRIRYEFKAKSIKKRKVSLTVSVDGVKVIPRSKRRNSRWPWEENKFIILHHPIYRIFYVSHDSQDLKIFSYIARDGGTNAFKCNVFKSKKKSQAMRIVRTVGQAFEVCHKLSLALATSNPCEEAHSLSGNEEVDALHDHSNKGKSQGDGASEPNSCDTQEEQNAIKPVNSVDNQCSPPITNESLTKKTDIEVSRISTSQNNNLKVNDSNVCQHVQLLKEQLELQSQQLQSVMTQIQILRDQLTVEKSARIEAQDQNHLLLVHNKELLEHIQKLVNRIYEIEGTCMKKEKAGESFHLSPPPAPDAKQYLENIRYLSGIDKPGQREASNLSFKSLSETSKISVTSGHLENHFAADPITKSSFPVNFSGQSSVLGLSQYGCTNSPKPGVSFNNVGFSLPTSPSNFSPSLDAIFKTDGFVCSSPKQARKIRNVNPANNAVDDFLPSNLIPHSPSFSQSSTSPGHKGKTQKVFDFDQTPAPYSSSSLFNFHENSGNDFKVNNSHDSLHHVSRESNASNKDSFIAQVTRDLAKMSTVDKCLSESAPGNKLHGDSFSLFKS